MQIADQNRVGGYMIRGEDSASSQPLSGKQLAQWASRDLVGL
jgi:hypothetical protein